MSDLYKDVRDFHEKFDHPVDEFPMVDVEFRIALINEECDELIQALKDQQIGAIMGEAVDLIYVVIGTLVALGLPFMSMWKIVHRANMTKEKNPEGGKPIKPKGWKKAELG